MEIVDISGLEFRYAKHKGNARRPGGRHPGFFLSIPELQVQRGIRVAIIGPSGSGKTTLVQLIAGILELDRGRIIFNGQSMSALSDADRRRRRLEEIGFVFQAFELIHYLSARENILLPNRLHAGLPSAQDCGDRVNQLARECGVDHLLDRLPNQLSQGERQRVAICRALLNEPPLLIADEPTGNLDGNTTRTVLDCMLEQTARHEQTLLMVTHDESLLPAFDRVIDFEEFLPP